MSDNDLLRLGVAMEIAKLAMADLAAEFNRLPPELKAALTAETEQGRGRGNIPNMGRTNYWFDALPDPREAELPDREKGLPDREKRPL